MNDQSPAQTFGLAVPGEVDKGALARDKLTLKAKARKVWFWIKFWIWMAIVAAVAGVSWFTYDAYKHRVTQVVTDMRPCSVEVGGEKITGVREYQYNYFDIFGMRLIDTAKIEVTTTIDYKGSDFLVGGLNPDGSWWSMKTSDGEFGKMKTKPAETYVFVIKGRMQPVLSSKFCK